MSSFNKSLYPSLAVGYMVLPESLADLYTRARWLASDQAPTQIQAALGDFIESGQLDRHVKRMKAIYARRRRTLVNAIEEHLAGTASIDGDISGLSVKIRLHTGLDDDELIQAALESGIALTSTRSFYTRNSPTGEFLLGYGNMTEQKIKNAVALLARTLQNLGV